jgi:hypothetical protein
MLILRWAIITMGLSLAITNADRKCGFNRAFYDPD